MAGKATDRLRALVDEGSFSPARDELASPDPLGWPGYLESVTHLKGAGVDESVVVGSATISGLPVEIAVFDFAFLGGSMGEVAGERLARGMERAAARRMPFVLITATG